MTWRVDVGDCVDLMAAMPACSVDAVVCDPPYGLEFMGKEWDRLGTVYGRKGNAADPKGQHFNEDPWEKMASKRPSGYAPKKVPRCRKCGKLTWGTGSCKCVESDVSYRHDESGFQIQAWHEIWATEALRVLKPGGHLLAFGGTRTSHRLACAIEDAGFEIRDTIVWLYGSGFPKSLDVGKAIDKRPGVRTHAQFAAHLAERRQATGLSRADVSEAVVGTRSGACWNWEHHQFPEARWWPALRNLLGLDDVWAEVISEAERVVVGESPHSSDRSYPRTFTVADEGIEGLRPEGRRYVTDPATPDAERWDGWGTALKPAHEPIVVARKPLAGTVAANVLEHGTGGLNVDGCRIEGPPRTTHADGNHQATSPHPMTWNEDTAHTAEGATGRWPANVVLDEQAATMLDQQSGEMAPSARNHGQDAPANVTWSLNRLGGKRGFTDSGGASRFFYTAKASRTERNAGLEGFEEVQPFDGGLGGGSIPLKGSPPPTHRNHHPTVKPVSLMRWLVRLVTPPDGLILDPFAGSGTTGIAAVLEGFNFHGCEQDAGYADIARARIGWWELHGHDALRIVAEQEAAENEREAVRQSGQMELL